MQPCPKITETPVLISNGFSKQFRVLLDKCPHSDITFIVGDEKEEFYMHKAILSARSSYFEAMFRPGGMSESSKSEIEIGRHDKDSFRRMMEFIYTAEILHLDDCSSAEIISLLEISHQYLLDDLASIAEAAACKIVKQDNIGKFMLLCATYNTLLLRDVCKRFVSVHGTKLRQVHTLTMGIFYCLHQTQLICAILYSLTDNHHLYTPYPVQCFVGRILPSRNRAVTGTWTLDSRRNARRGHEQFITSNTIQ